ncbi:MAG: dihydrolipoamide acetyltransferase family protein [Saprospiraceae bacterium]|nr:dihydrolipoamide acetyltransferase family protein [Saprospiraceae bacterium]
MAQVELIMPKMGESIMEATILKWLKKEGDTVELDETILEIATDKVDSEIPSPVAGVLTKILFAENETVEVGKVIALIATEGEDPVATPSPAVQETMTEAVQNGNPRNTEPAPAAPVADPVAVEAPQAPVDTGNVPRTGQKSGKFYSPLVRNIAAQEGITIEELDALEGSGLNGRVTKRDILQYIEQRSAKPATAQPGAPTPPPAAVTQAAPATPPPAATAGENVEIIEMDRMRKLIAQHMVMSKQTSPHVTSYVEADVTNLVQWRNAVKDEFLDKHGQKITFTPIFIEAVVRAIKDFPMINISVDGDKILRKKDINIGMATALPSGNLIVPVIRGADSYNLVGLTKAVNDLATRARDNKLKPEEIQGGTFTLTNVGTFGNVMGTPIINQPQVAILATGAIRKKPAVVETEYGDLIAIRQMMFLSLSYDHRVVDGFLGGSFLRRIGDYLEAFDTNQQI